MEVRLNQDPTEDNPIKIHCDFTDIDSKMINSIKWFTNLTGLNIEDLEFSEDNRTIEIANLSHRIHNGDYKCQVELITGQIFESTKTIIVLCKYICCLF